MAIVDSGKRGRHTEPALCIDAPRASEGAEERTLAFTMMPGAVSAKTVTVACATGGDTATGGTGDANCQRDTLPATQIDGLFFLSSATSMELWELSRQLLSPLLADGYS